MTSQRGNALLYVLLGIALFAALSYTLSRNTETAGGNLSEEKATLMANRLISHAGQMSQAIQQMLMTGSHIEDIDFTKPGEAGYGTGAQHQVFHPSGGGINVFDQSDPNWYENASPNSGWQSMTVTNVEWTPTSADDLIYTFISVNSDICRKINEIMAGQSTIAPLTVSHNQLFIEGASSDSDFTAVGCPDCVGNMSMCVSNAAADRYAVYNIVASQ
jgi:hypothetical protein